MLEITLRPATHDDVGAVATVWHRGWADGHAGHVPPGLHAHRTLDHFLTLVPSRIPTTTVAISDRSVVGFVTVHAEEIEQVYVDASARGTGMAAALLDRGEAIIGQTYDRAWLAVVAGNERARRFYERRGWVDAGAFDYSAETAAGPFTVPALRYEKDLRG
jgi:ribosomal protein S18 acetylase RimI-like enzyme